VTSNKNEMRETFEQLDIAAVREGAVDFSGSSGSQTVI
jgi:hypothetical protein